MSPPPASREAWQAARRILCVRLDSLGDVLMCTPAMRALLESGCDAGTESGSASTSASSSSSSSDRSLTLLGSAAGAAAVPFIPEIDDVIVHHAPWMKDGPGQPRQADLALVETLAARAFDAAVIFTTYTQSALPAALLCHLAGIPLRLAHCRENPYRLLSDWVPDPEPATVARHEVMRQLQLVGHIGCRTANLALSFVPRQMDIAVARARLEEVGVDADGRWLLLHPGASAASRRYPPGHWARTLRLLAQDPGLPLVLTGSAAEAPLVDAIRHESGVITHSLAGRLALGELGAALGLAAVAVTNNTGPAHMAAALGTPVVDLYALTNPQHTPWNVRSRVLFQDVPCRFCFKSSCPAGHHDCLAGVEPERVAAAVRELLQPRHTGAAAPPCALPEQADVSAG